MKLNYSFTEQDYIDFSLRYAKKRNRKILVITSVVLFAVLVVILLASNAPPIMMPICAIFVVIIYALGVLSQNAMLKHSAKQNIESAGNDFFKSDKTLELLDDGIESQSNLGTSKFRYESINSLSKDDRFMGITIKGGSVLFIPLYTPGASEFYDALVEKTRGKS